MNIPDAGPRFGSTKLASAAIRGALTLFVLAALLLMAARPTQAQTETVLYNFTGGSDGANPQSNLTSDGAGNFYGTTMNGGLFGFGTVFEISPNGSGGWNETVLYSFSGGADGANPIGPVIFDGLGNLYGTTEFGGPYHNKFGVVFELSPVGTSWNETVLYSFPVGGQGNNLQTGLIMDKAGNLYGITQEGVFELSPSDGGWAYQDIYIFASGGRAGLTMDAAGNIFGVTSFTNPFAFELLPNGNGGWNPTHIYGNFGDATPEGTPIVIPYQTDTEMLFGTTEFGGGKKQGNVYMLWNIDRKNGMWLEENVHGFQGGKDGSNPRGGVVFGAFYLPMYGTTTAGGQYNAGTVYEVGAGWKERVLWSFNGTNGAQPYGSLILDSTGNLYGTTSAGGSNGYGAVFEVNPSPVVTTLTSSPNPSTYGQVATFTAVVTSSLGAPPDGETITFKQGATVLGTGTLSGGTATFSISTLGVGSHAITAVYGGDSHLAASTSKSVKQVVSKATTTTTLASSRNPSLFGQSVTFTAVVTSSLGAPPDGETVTFMNSATALGTGTLSGGSASFNTSTLAAGNHSITAVYGGDVHFAGSTSKAVKQSVETQGVYGVVSPTSVNFGQVVEGQTSPAQRVSLINIGNSELTVSDISISGDFALAINHCANGVKPATHCDVYVTFTPQSLGVGTGTLTFMDNASNSPQSASLTGTGATAVPE